MKDKKHFNPEISSSFENISFFPRIEKNEIGFNDFFPKIAEYKILKDWNVNLSKRK